MPLEYRNFTFAYVELLDCNATTTAATAAAATATVVEPAAAAPAAPANPLLLLFNLLVFTRIASS